MNSNIEKIKALLKENKLPYEDIISSKVEFITREFGEKIVGCIGVENYGEDALLRSFAVDDKYKSKGIGKELLDKLIETCQQKGINKLHLLTTTADKYFLKKGFQISERSEAPQAILLTKEFSDICPASSVYMVKELKF